MTTKPSACAEPGCGSTVGVSLSGYCWNHDPDRREAAQTARAKGGTTTGARTTKIRTVPVDQVPPLHEMDDAVTASAWLFSLGVSGQLDPSTVREGNRSVTTFKDALHKRDLLRRIKELERQVKELERGRG